MKQLNHLSTKSKLIIILLLVGIGSTITIAALAWQTSKQALVQAAANELRTVRTLKSAQIEAYFENLEKELLTLAEDQTVIDAMIHLNREFQRLDRQPPEDAWLDSLDRYYTQEFFPRLEPNIDYKPTLEQFLPYRDAATYLQYHYIANSKKAVGKKHLLDNAGDGSEYSRWHEVYHPFLRHVAERFGYADLYLIDAAKLDVIYSINKKTDFATDLYSGPYTTSQLGYLAPTKEVTIEGEVIVGDFSLYEPSYGASAAFLLTPIYNGVHFIGIIAAQLPTDQLDMITTGGQNWSAYGMGESGDSYILGIDYYDLKSAQTGPTLRSNARLWLEDPERYRNALQEAGKDPLMIENVKRFQSTIGLVSANDEWISSALNDRVIGMREKENYLGETVLSAYGPLEIEGLTWGLFAEMKLSEIMQPVYEQQRNFLIAGAILTALITLASMLLANYFTWPLKFLNQQIEQINAGDLDTTTALQAENEYGRLSHSINTLVDRIREKDALLTQEQKRNESLMLNILPQPIAERVKRGETQIVENVQQTTILYAEIIGFEELAEAREEHVSAAQLKELFEIFDTSADRMGIELRPLVGTNFLATCGLTKTRLDHINRMIDFGLRLQTILQQSNQDHQSGLEIKIGIHTGEVTAGLIGDKRIRYGLWGKAITVANAIQIAARPDTILVSQPVYEHIHEVYELQPQNELQLNGNIEMDIWLLNTHAIEDRPAIGRADGKNSKPLTDIVEEGLST